MWLHDAYILVRCDITVTEAPATQVAFKSCAPFTKCITKTDGATIYNSDDLDLVMPIYNLIEYSSNYPETTGSLWFYSKNEATNFYNNIENSNDFKSFKYNVKLLETTVAQAALDEPIGILKNAAIAVPLKYLNGDHFKSL